MPRCHVLAAVFSVSTLLLGMLGSCHPYDLLVHDRFEQTPTTHHPTLHKKKKVEKRALSCRRP